MNYTQKGLQRALPMLAAALGRATGVTVVIGDHPRAMVNDKKVIHLPKLPSFDGRTTALTLSQIVHEAGHLRFTDFGYVDGQSMTPFEHALFNGLEDYRVDKGMSQLYPGAENCRREALAIAEEMGYVVKPEGQDLATVLTISVAARLMGRFLDRPLMREIEVAADVELSKQLPAATVQKIRAEVDGFYDLSSTEDTYHAMRRLVDLIKNEADELEQQASQPPEQQRSNQDAGKCDGSSKGGSDSDGVQSHGAVDHGSAGEAERRNITPGQAARALKDALDSTPRFDGDTGSAVKEALGEVVQEHANKAAWSDDVPLSVPVLQEPVGAQRTTIDLAEVRGASMALSARLDDLLQGMLDSGRTYSAQSGRLVAKRLWRVPTGDYAVFRRRSEESVINTAVYLLLDISGSMSGSIATVMEAGLALALALENTPNLVSQVVAFPFGAGNALLKSFNTSVRSAQGNFSAVAANGGTPMSEALLRAGIDLLERDESRRILIVGTDGQPDHVPSTTRILKDLRDEGIETVGVGIGQSHAIAQLFPKSRSIQRVTELPNALFNVLGEQLLAA